MPKKFSIIDMRNWLKEYEKGKSIARIAKDKKHDIRTITRGIEKAKRDMDVRAARSDMVRDALQKHLEDLAEVTEFLQSAIVIPPPNTALYWEEDAPRIVVLPHAKATYESDRWTLNFDIEGSTKWDLLEEHMRREVLWKGVSQWKHEVLAHLETRRTLMQEIVLQLRKKTKLEVVKNIDEAGDSYLYPAGIVLIYSEVLNWALKTKELDFERGLEESEPYLNYGRERTAILLNKGSVGKQRLNVMAAVRGIQKSPIIKEVFTSYKTAEEITKKTSRNIEELSLLRLMPGLCRVCRRIGL